MHHYLKDVQNIASKQIFARWQAILSVFDFTIEYLKGSNNSLPDFLTREFLTTSYNMNPTPNPFQLPCKNIKPRKRRANSSQTTPLTPFERLIFFRRDREDLTLEIVEKLPDELYSE